MGEFFFIPQSSLIHSMFVKHTHTKWKRLHPRTQTHSKGCVFYKAFFHTVLFQGKFFRHFVVRRVKQVLRNTSLPRPALFSARSVNKRSGLDRSAETTARCSLGWTMLRKSLVQKLLDSCTTKFQELSPRNSESRIFIKIDE